MNDDISFFSYSMRLQKHNISHHDNFGSKVRNILAAILLFFLLFYSGLSHSSLDTQNIKHNTCWDSMTTNTTTWHFYYKYLALSFSTLEHLTQKEMHCFSKCLASYIPLQNKRDNATKLKFMTKREMEKTHQITVKAQLYMNQINKKNKLHILHYPPHQFSWK